MIIQEYEVLMTQEEYEALPKNPPERITKNDLWITEDKWLNKLSSAYDPETLYDFVVSGENYPEVPSVTYEGYVQVLRRIRIIEKTV